jgi:hypothetical protein
MDHPYTTEAQDRARTRLDRGDFERLQQSIRLHMTVAIRAAQMLGELVDDAGVALVRRNTRGADQPVSATDALAAATRLRQAGEYIDGLRRVTRP